MHKSRKKALQARKENPFKVLKSVHGMTKVQQEGLCIWRNEWKEK
jgi:hypothetical protein